MVATME